MKGLENQSSFRLKRSEMEKSFNILHSKISPPKEFLWNTAVEMTILRTCHHPSFVFSKTNFSG